MPNTRNANDLSRFMGNKALDNRTVGNTYGERSQRRESIENKKVQRAPARQPVDNFARRENGRADPKFANPKDKYAKSFRPKGMTAHKTVSTELLERGRVGTKPSDSDMLRFLDKIRTDDRLSNGRNVSRYFGPKPSASKGTPAARKAVAGMARAQATTQKVSRPNRPITKKA